MEENEDKQGGFAGIMAVVGVLLLIVAGYLGLDFGEFDFGDFGGDSAEFDNDNLPDDYQWYDIFFTNPTCPGEADRIGGVDEIIADDIYAAEDSIDIATFDLDSLAIIDALIDAEDRGLEVRVVVDNEHNPDSTTNRLRRNGISVIEDRRSPLMHNKFIVIDEQFLWVGSMNFTSNGVYCNNNNIVFFDHAPLAANYRTEVDEMYIEREFGPTSSKNTETRFNEYGIEIQNYFAPETEVAPVLAREVARADEEILFMAFSFTNEDIGEAMIERAEDGVSVYGVFEKNGSDTSTSYFRDMRRAGLDTLQIRVDGNSRIMHHKVIIIDREITIFGSFNFSNNANDNNDENVIIINDPIFAEIFIEEFDLVWDEGVDP